MVGFGEQEALALHPDIGRRREQHDRSRVPGAVADLVNVAFRRLANQLQFVGWTAAEGFQ